MNAKEYLNQIRLYKNRLEHDMARLDELRALATATGSKELKADVVQSSIKNAGLEDTVGDLVDYERKIRADIDQYLRMKEKIISQINNLSAGENTNKYIELLLRRYNLGEFFEEIARAMKYTPSHVRHLHREALEAFENQYLKGE